MGLIGMMGRTAVITATASATANRMERRRTQRYAEQEAFAQQQQQQQPVYYEQQAPPPAPAAAPSPAGLTMDEKIAQIERLGQLKVQGILSDDEFAQQKAKILGS